MQDENKKALMYLGIAILVVAVWLFVKSGSPVATSDTSNAVIPSVTPIPGQPVIEEEPDGKGEMWR